jgi:hypothetical protein
MGEHNEAPKPLPQLADVVKEALLLTGHIVGIGVDEDGGTPFEAHERRGE